MCKKKLFFYILVLTTIIFYILTNNFNYVIIKVINKQFGFSKNHIFLEKNVVLKWCHFCGAYQYL
ncbi:hypothetical protein PA0027 [Candidatus Phytoplasma australiense]|uniref:Uncharacterized protein n=1 Tax=Phytoplasma australiense TaxID=59748 RepID=B1V8X5_PHYAS|nr:hypothetical protein PA0027 [Candidatus Phytoplasma australiense]